MPRWTSSSSWPAAQKGATAMAAPQQSRLPRRYGIHSCTRPLAHGHTAAHIETTAAAPPPLPGCPSASLPGLDEATADAATASSPVPIRYARSCRCNLSAPTMRRLAPLPLPSPTPSPAASLTAAAAVALVAATAGILTFLPPFPYGFSSHPSCDSYLSSTSIGMTSSRVP